MNSIVNFDLTPLLTEIATRENVSNPVIDYKYKTNKGDGYTTVVNAADINGTNKTLSVVLKTAHANPEFRKAAPINYIFVRESYFYDGIMPAYHKFQSDFDLETPFNSAAKCYATNCEEEKEVIVLENLRNRGYGLWNLKNVMDGEHIEFVMREYAKLHGVSIAMKRKNNALFESLCEKLDHEKFVDVIETAGGVQLIVHLGNKLKRIFNHDTESDVLEYFSNFNDNIGKEYMDTYKFDEHAVITHGDCWSNNMMFKYGSSDDLSKPESMRFIDFQLVKRGSPACDLAYFLYSCTTKDTLDNLEHYLKVYHQALSTYLQQFDLNADLEYPFSVLMDQWKKYSKFGMISSFMLLKVILGDTDADEVPDFGKTTGEDFDITKTFDFEMKNEEEYKRRAKDVIIHCYNNKYF